MTDTSEITSGNDMIGATLALAQHYKASRGIQDISYDLLAATAIISRGSLGYNEEEFLAAAKYIWKMTQEDSTDHTQWMINKWSKLVDQEYMLPLIWGLSTGLVQSKALRQNQNLQAKLRYQSLLICRGSLTGWDPQKMMVSRSRACLIIPGRSPAEPALVLIISWRNSKFENVDRWNGFAWGHCGQCTSR